MSIEAEVETALETPVSELIGIVVGLLVAIQKAKERWGGTLEVCPPDVQLFVNDLQDAANEYMGYE